MTGVFLRQLRAGVVVFSLRDAGKGYWSSQRLQTRQK